MRTISAGSTVMIGITRILLTDLVAGSASAPSWQLPNGTPDDYRRSRSPTRGPFPAWRERSSQCILGVRNLLSISAGPAGSIR